MSGMLATLIYNEQKNQVRWQGYKLLEGAPFDSFMSDHVAARLFDQEGLSDFEAHLRGLAVTDFAQDSLRQILSAEVEEERDWAVGEAIAEAWLSIKYNIVWPWNMERDKRTPKSSLPGADLVGFHVTNTQTLLVLGEVKTSGENRYPPQVMSGRSGGIGHQIDKLATKPELIATLLKWLWPRCKYTSFKPHFDSSVMTYFQSGNKAVSLYGVLIRDTDVNELDLKGRGFSLGDSIVPPTTCNLIALYIPGTIADLPCKAKGGDA